MPMHDFFRVNMPYGLQLLPSGKWIVFNREYVPIGCNSRTFAPSIEDEARFDGLPILAKYELTPEKIVSIVGQNAVDYTSDGKIHRFVLYEDRTFPMRDEHAWQHYSKKLYLLSEISIL